MSAICDFETPIRGFEWMQVCPGDPLAVRPAWLADGVHLSDAEIDRTA